MLRITSDWEDVEAAHDRGSVVVYFTAEWCGPCRQLKPEYAKASVRDPETDYFLVDIDKVQPYVIQDWNIQSIPQVLFWEAETEGASWEFVIHSRKADKIVDEVRSLQA